MKTVDGLHAIGEMAKLCNVSIKALRHYDDKGLLTPAFIDPTTNYRYYTEQQVLNVMIIKEYKSLNFSLEEIKTANKGPVPELVKCLQSKLLATNKKIKELNYIKDRITKYINEFEKDGILNSNNKCKDVDEKFFLQFYPKFKVAYTRYKCIHNPGMILERYRQLNEVLESNKLYKIGPLMAIFHDSYKNYNYNNADIEVCCEIVGEDTNKPCVRELGDFWVIKGLHQGPYSTLVDTYQESLKWLDKNNLRYLGHSAIERYIVDAVSSGDINKYVTEIILPIDYSLDSPPGLDIIVS